MKYLLPFAFLLTLWSCNDDSTLVIDPQLTLGVTVEKMKSDYSLLPEEAISFSLDSTVLAQYAQPTEKYPHGVMGDDIEAEQLVVAVDGQFYDVTLEDNYLFEDLRPRIYDVDGDGLLEFITIRTHVERGAGIAIYKVINEELVEYAYVAEIGFLTRWLNLVTIDDLDDDGIVELAWIQTPHIGGILKVAKFSGGEMAVLDEAEEQYSNHWGRTRQLCMSVLTAPSNQKIFYVPSQAGDKIVGFSLFNNRLIIEETIDQVVDFLIPLSEQYPFQNIILDPVNCIDL
jgi:hypothetical protein